MRILIYILLFFSGNLLSQTTFYIPYKCGYSDPAGLTLIESQYDTVSLFNKGFAVVGIENQFGLINTDGDLILPIKFDEVNSYNEANEFIKARIRNKWKYYNTKGRSIKVRAITSAVLYDCVSSSYVTGGMAALYLHESNGKYGFVKYLCNNIKADSCKVLQNPRYSNYLELDGRHLALENENGWNIYDYKGQLVQKHNISSIKEKPIGRRGNQFYRFEIDNKFGLISANGKIVVEPRYDSIDEQPGAFYLKSKEWYWSKKELFLVTTSNDYFYIDEDGHEYRCEG